MSRQEADRRDLGKSLAQPENSVSFSVSRRVSQPIKATTFCSPCTLDALGARATLIWWVSCSPSALKGVVTQVWAASSAWRETDWDREWDIPSTRPGEPPGTRFLRPVDAIIPGTRSPPICIATITGRGTSLPHLPGLGCHTD